ncbi:MAG: efflux RND transporter periplasmic adaptor subunit [Planctomycetota bacterium]|jgi:RND family efflux transporter MFP subunit
MRKRRLAVIAAAVAVPAVATAAVYLIRGGPQDEPLDKAPVIRPVKTMVLRAPGSALRRTFPGRVKAAEEVDLSFQVSGLLVELPIKEGQDVARNELLARLDERDFQNKLASATAKAAEAKSNLERIKLSFEKGVATRKELDEARKAYDVAEADRKIAAKALADTELRAPFAGVVARTFVENYQNVEAKKHIVSLQDVSTIKIVVDIPETIVMDIKKYRSAETVAIFEARPDLEFDLEVSEFGTEADPQTLTYPVTLAMPAPEELTILPGMSATVRMDAPWPEGEGAADLVIPVSAVFSDEPEKSHVWVIDKDSMTVHKRQVRIGDMTGNNIIILGGLKSGEEIAIAGVSHLREGMEVRRLKQPLREPAE